jgi:magnesium transporter
MALKTPDLQEIRAALAQALAARSASAVSDLLLSLPERDAAEMLDALPSPELAAAVSLLGDQRAATVLEHLDAGNAARLLVRLSRTDAADVVEEMSPDEHLLGVLSLRDLVLAPRETPIGEITNRNPLTIHADADQEVAARVLADHGLLAIPVVDADSRLLGIVTSDDAAEEATEDVAKMGGSTPLDKPYLRTSPLELVHLQAVIARAGGDDDGPSSFGPAFSL